MRARNLLLLLVVLAPLAVGCGRKKEAEVQKPAVPVRVGRVSRQTMPIRLRTVGQVQAWQVVQVRPQVGGQLVRAGFTEGEEVKQGQLLFEIDRRPYEAALAQAKANLARNRATLSQARADVKRFKGLVRRNFITRQQYEQAQTAASTAAAAVAADQAAVRNAQLNLAYCTLRSPIAGRTGTVMVQAGNVVQANQQQALVVVQQIHPVKVAFSVPQEHLTALLTGGGHQKVVATAPGGRAQEGVLDFIENQVDPQTGTILLRGRFDNQDTQLWPGQSVDVVLTLGERRDALVVPTAAVQRTQSGAMVYVVKADRTVETRQVRVLDTSADVSVIGGGLQAGETVVTDGQLRLVPGAQVQVREGA